MFLIFKYFIIYPLSPLTVARAFNVVSCSLFSSILNKKVLNYYCARLHSFWNYKLAGQSSCCLLFCISDVVRRVFPSLPIAYHVTEATPFPIVIVLKGFPLSLIILLANLELCLPLWNRLSINKVLSCFIAN